MARIVVVGAGAMGAGIAEVLANVGNDVTVADTNADAAELVAGRLTIHATSSVEAAVVDAEFVFEAIAEDEGAKLELYRVISAASRRAIIVSNTSSILPSTLAEGVQDPSRFVIAHFFHPAVLVPLVEVVPAPQTVPETIDRVALLMRSAGKQVVILGREVAGFVANRLQAAMLREAFALERDGVISFEDIDVVVRAALAARWAAAGPFGVVDLGGLDIWESVTGRLFPTLSIDSIAPAALSDRVAAGSLGAKSGRGFYDHTPEADAGLHRRMAIHFDAEFGGGDRVR